MGNISGSCWGYLFYSTYCWYRNPGLGKRWGRAHSTGWWLETGLWGEMWDHCHRSLRHQEYLKNEELEISVAIFTLDEVKLKDRIMESSRLEKTQRSSRPTLISSHRCPLSHVTKCHIHSGFWTLQRMWLHHCSGQSVPVLDHFFHEEIFPGIQPESPLVQLEVGPHSPSPPGTEGGDSQGCTIPLLCLLNLFQGFWMLCPAFSPPTSSSTILKGENRPKLC